MAFKMKGHTLPGINQRMNNSALSDGRAKSSAFQAGCAEGSTDPGCGGNFKVKKKNIFGKIASFFSGNKSNPDARYSKSKGNNKTKKRDYGSQPKTKGGGHIVRSSTSRN